ncbi:hypothetical protein VKI21_11980 [Cyanobacterium aponinum UTEX 3222]|uniref:hypothetical protein n=1 Tax=Cyanobacterium aponinum TaxID=379064 RepID=UPI002B4BB546|nr:hypothetical protein [Cyanobacterium aponinum]WRL38903.1 hypothetical protein VKI22_02065 [Cyanobacterium aponinum UTEX 3221]WRL40784.1 hypothetical protein VKI21_11980 [Cyanobacterium aponinum UTEX 3222]
MDRAKIGSMTAKGGFINEQNICDKFNAWQKDNEAREWLFIMGYDSDKIKSLKAIHIPVKISKSKALDLGILPQKYEETVKYKKADIQIKLEILIDDVLYTENISLKKANSSAGFNQVDKRSVTTYKAMWNFDNEIETWLKLFTGDILPQHILSPDELSNLKDFRRLFMTEMPDLIVNKIINFFSENKVLIVNDILKGRGGLSAEWLLVTKKDKNANDKLDWILKDINTACNFFAQGDVKISPKGSLYIGKITMQRKGGTPDPTSLQFKINPLQLFE